MSFYYYFLKQSSPVVSTTERSKHNMNKMYFFLFVSYALNNVIT